MSVTFIDNWEGVIDNIGDRMIKDLYFLVNAGGGARTCLPKFKFSANFPIGLRVIFFLYR